jgi:D-glycero-D-manno-heptose 1,7-bisphosphate phosphatase
MNFERQYDFRISQLTIQEPLDKRIVFLDRDGTVNVRRNDPNDDLKNYVLHWHQFDWIPGAREAVVRLLDRGYGVIFVSNQSGINKDLVENSEISRVFHKMRSQIVERTNAKDPLVYYYFCPHTAAESCECRKPKPGMFYSAAWEWGIRFKDSWMVGDAVSDMKAAWTAGIRKLIRLDSLEDPESPEYSYAEASRLINRRIADGLRIDSLVNAVDFILSWDTDPLR